MRISLATLTRQPNVVKCVYGSARGVCGLQSSSRVLTNLCVFLELVLSLAA